VSRVQQWSKKFSGASFIDAEYAAKHGWDHPDLLKVLKGDKEVKFTETPTVTNARLAYLEKNGRTEDAISVSRAMGVDRHNRVVEDLLMVGRVDEAVEVQRKRESGRDVLFVALLSCSLVVIFFFL